MARPKDKQISSDLSKLNPIDRKLIDLILQTPSITDTDLAKKLKINRATVVKHKNYPEVKAAIDGVQISAIEMYTEAQAEAVETLKELMKSENEYVRLQAADKFIKSLQTIKIDGTLKTKSEIIYLDKQDASL